MKNVKKIISMILLSSLVTTAIILIPCLVSNYNNNLHVSSIESWSNQENSLNYIPIKSNDVVQMSEFRYEDIGYQKRDIQNQYYDSPCWTQYHDKYNFIYPGYNKNYESGNNRWFGTIDNPKIINGTQEVYNELVPNTNYRYNNSDWIVSEIENGTFKKHHAADNFVETDLNKIENSVTRKFIIGTNTFGPLGLGLYAPPGEEITIKFDEVTWNEMERTNFRNIQFVINSNFWDNKPEGDSSEISNRYPFICSTFNNIDHEFKIGSPFGGAITIFINDTLKSESSSPIYNNSLPITFTVEGALPCMLYQDGQTEITKFYSDLDLLKNGMIAPVIQVNSAYFSFNLPWVDISNSLEKLNKIKYPSYNFRKIIQFFFLGNYYNGRNSLRRINMRLCNDIWGGAYAWGGGNHISAPLEFGISLLSENLNYDFGANNWGLLHEINHNFQQNNAFFSKRSHGETNQATYYALSLIGDVGRYRNEFNYTGEKDFSMSSLGWTRCENPFILNKNFIDSQRADEYTLYAELLYLIGPLYYGDYVRWDVNNHPCWMTNWNGLEEIRQISENLHLNLWPAFEYFGKFWRDSWPISYQSATIEEKKIIDSLNKYPAIDFVGNLYATGSYIYDCKTNSYIYTGDYLPAYEIIAGQSKEFDFSKYFISNNPNFKWKGIEFDNTTKLGGKLLYDEKTKVLTYIPNNDQISDIDEFDVTFIPDEFTNKPDNYVPGYKFKFKIRQVVNSATIKLYESSNISYTNGYELLNYFEKNSENYIYELPYTRFSNEGYRRDNSGAKISFNFVAPYDGSFQFLMKYDDYIKVNVNDKFKYLGDQWTNIYKNIGSWNLKKGDLLKFDIFIANKISKSNLDIKINCGNNTINFFDNILIPNYEQFLDKYSIDELLNFRYESRQIDYVTFNNNITKTIYNSYYQYNYVDPKTYSLYSSYKNVNNLSIYKNGYYFEQWNEDFGPNQSRTEFTLTFDSPKVIKSFIFGHRTDQHSNARPTDIKIVGIDENNNEYVMYNGEYNGRNNSYTYFNISNNVPLKSLKIYGVNKLYYGIIWSWFICSEEYFSPISNSYSFINNNIKINNKWEIMKSNVQNLSIFNNVYLYTNKQDSIIEFNLKNTNGFIIVGQNNNYGAEFDVFINDQFIETIKINSNQVLMDYPLYSYSCLNSKDLNVKIVTKNDAPLFLNYFMTFGNNTELVK